MAQHARDRVLAHVVAELREFTADPATAPQRVLVGHSHDGRDRDGLVKELRSTLAR
jgi:hypothetical protein